MVVWWQAFLGCHSITDTGLVRDAWPDGGAYMDQEQTVLDAFGIMADELRKERQR